jgi:hypothetical protein
VLALVAIALLCEVPLRSVRQGEAADGTDLVAVAQSA